MLSDMILRSLNLDEDKLKATGDDSLIFVGSEQLLMNQVKYQSEKTKEKHDSSPEGDEEGGESDAFHRFKN